MARLTLSLSEQNAREALLDALQECVYVRVWASVCIATAEGCINELFCALLR